MYRLAGLPDIEVKYPRDVEFVKSCAQEAFGSDTSSLWARGFNNIPNPSPNDSSDSYQEKLKQSASFAMERDNVGVFHLLVENLSDPVACP